MDNIFDIHQQKHRLELFSKISVNAKDRYYFNSTFCVTN